MKHVVPHDIGQERARKVSEEALQAYSEKFSKYSPRVTWVSANKAQIAFTVKGMNISGTLEVLDKSIDMDLDVPFLLRPFKGQALQVIEREIRDWLARAKTT